MEKDSLCMRTMSVSYRSAMIYFVKLTVITIFAYNQGVLATNSYANARLSRPSHCPDQVISWAHRYHSFWARSVLECASACRSDIPCVAVVFEVGSSLCYLSNSKVRKDCSNTIGSCGNCKYYEVIQEVVCENGGMPSATYESCTCPDGYYGNTCNISYKDCHQYAEKGLMYRGQEGVYFVKPSTAPIPFPVYCDYMSNQNLLRTQVANRKDITPSFNLSWQEYQQGFGDLNSNTYWMGLEKIHHLTNTRQYQLRFQVQSPGSNKVFQYYENFVVNSETNGYALTFVGPTKSRDLGDCLTEVLGAKFSTYDNDNDDSDNVHCARQHGGGWWFRGDNCSSCNPLGPILTPFNGTRKGVAGEAFWIHDLGDVIPFIFRMFLVSSP